MMSSNERIKAWRQYYKDAETKLNSYGLTLDCPSPLADIALAMPTNGCQVIKRRLKNTSKYKGVAFMSSRNKWRARLTHNRKTYFLGLFDEEEDAGKAYNDKAKELFGDNACLNTLDI
jgi:hypothetical protein